MTAPFGISRAYFNRQSIHNGVDFACPTGTELFAISDGVIENVKKFYTPHVGYGKNVSLRCKNEKYLSFYGHCSEIFVKEGQKMLQGQIIARSGATGFCVSAMVGGKGAHLHWGLKRYDKWVDPLEYMANHMINREEAVNLQSLVEKEKEMPKMEIIEIEGEIPDVDGEDEENYFYLVKKGDTLSGISKEFYDDADFWNAIFKANKEIIENSDKIYPGQKLRIPKSVAIN